MKKRKGFTLTEVLVAIALFAIIFASVISSIAIISNSVNRQKEYVYFETICLDIDKYSTKFGIEWNVEYFKRDNSTNDTFSEDKQYYTANLTYLGGGSDFRSNAKYELYFKYDKDEIRSTEETIFAYLFIDVIDLKAGRKVIDSLNYGSARYSFSKDKESEYIHHEA